METAPMTQQAVPSGDSILVCRICFMSGGDLYPMTAHKMLYNAYEIVTGLLMQNEECLPRYLCSDCTRQLLQCARFKSSALQAHMQLLEMARKHGCITLELIQAVSGTQRLYNSALPSKQAGQELDMELLEGPGVDDTPVGCIEVKIEGASNPDTVNEGLYNYDAAAYVKVEIENIDNNMDNANDFNRSDVKVECVDDVVMDHIDDKSVVKHAFTASASLANIASLIRNSVEDDNKEHLSNVEEMNADVTYGSIGTDDASDASLPPGQVREDAKRNVPVPLMAMASGELCHTNPPVNGPFATDNFICDICQYEAVNAVQLSSHLKAHAARTSHSCPMCNYITIDKSKLRRHVKVHSGEKPFVCVICSKAFITENQLQSHRQTHSDVKPFACDDCGKSFKTEPRLRSHMQLHEDKLFACNFCDKAYSLNSTLQLHLRTHSGEKLSFCQTCDKSFTTKTNLQRHLRTHSGEKPFPCKVCNKSLSSKSHLQSHMLTHVGERNYLCEVCNKAFSTKTNLQRHKQSHYGVEMHLCRICNKAYNRKDRLKSHLRTHYDQKSSTAKCAATPPAGRRMST